MKICEKIVSNPNYSAYLVEYVGDIENEYKDNSEICLFKLTPTEALIILKNDTIQKVVESSKTIVKFDITKLYTLAAISPLETSNIARFHKN